MGFVTATNQDASQDAADLWHARLEELRRDGKMRQVIARRTRCPNKFANGRHLSQNDPYPANQERRDEMGPIAER